jgi:hypothetical protein
MERRLWQLSLTPMGLKDIPEKIGGVNYNQMYYHLERNRERLAQEYGVVPFQ